MQTKDLLKRCGTSLQKVREKLHLSPVTDMSPFPKWRLHLFVKAVVITFLIGFFDVLGVRSNSSTLTENVVQSVLAPLYGSPAQKAVTVVLIDKDYFGASQKRLDKKWPLPSRDFAFNILSPIADADPAAIFIDIAFTDAPRYISSAADQPDGEAALREIARDLVSQSETVPIIVGDATGGIDTTGSCSVPFTDFETLRQRRVQSSVMVDEVVKNLGGRPSNFEFALADWDGTSTDYPFSSMAIAPQNSCHALQRSMSELVGKGSATNREQLGYLVTPAVALIDTVCRSGRTLPGVGVPKLCPQMRRLYDPKTTQGYGLYALSDTLAKPLYVRWGVKLSRLAQKYSGTSLNAEACEAQRMTGWWSKTWAVTREVFFAAFPGVKNLVPETAYRRPCSYIDTVSASVIADPRRIGFSDEQAAQFRKDYFQNRIVLVGTAVPFVKDTIPSPVNGEMPGVFLHAMALENMLNFGTSYPHQPGLFWVGFICFVEGLVVAFLAFGGRVFVWVSDLVGIKLGIRKDWRSKRTFAGFLVLACILILLILSLTVAGCWLIARWFGTLYGSPMFIVLASVTAAIDSCWQDYFHRSQD